MKELLDGLSALIWTDTEWRPVHDRTLSVRVQGIRLHRHHVTRVGVRWLSKQNTLQLAEVILEDGPPDIYDAADQLLKHHGYPSILGAELGTGERVTYLLVSPTGKHEVGVDTGNHYLLEEVQDDVKTPRPTLGFSAADAAEA